MANNIARALLFSCFAIAFVAAAHPATASGDEEQVLRKQADDYAKLFAAGNASALASFWTADCTYTADDGMETHGRDNMQKMYESFFKHSGPQPLAVSIKSIKFPAKNVAIEEGTCSAMRGSTVLSTSKYTVVHVKQDGKWLMDTETETDVPPPAPSIGDMGWLAGSWTAKLGDKEVHFNGHWDPNKNFLLFARQDATTGATGEMQIIGYNPASSQIVSWHFDSHGGFGNGRWSNDGDTWVESAYGVQPNGKSSHARYVLHKISPDKFTWRSTNRMIAGLHLPETQEVIVTRDGSSK